MVQCLRTVLESRGIPCEVRGIDRGIGIGELPPIECWPELWVTDDARIQEAEAIVAESIRAEATQETWRCPECGEEVEAQFGACWKCRGSDTL